jgi:hypothetical protein
MNLAKSNITRSEKSKCTSSAQVEGATSEINNPVRPLSHDFVIHSILTAY